VTLNRAIAFIDMETTGLDPLKDRIIEFAAVVIHPDGNRNQYRTLLNPGFPIPPEAAKLHGITDADVAGAPRFADKARGLHRALAGKDLGGYNLRSFDLTMLDEEFRRCGMKLDLTGVRIVDASQIFRKKEPRTLSDAVRKYCGREHMEAHGALADAKAAANVLEGQMLVYPELAEMPFDQLAEFCLPDRQPADIAGKLFRDVEGDLCFAFGKYRDQKLRLHLDYCAWMLEKGLRNFPGSTLDTLKEEMARVGAFTRVGHE
jgi:DNA polymerase-3 subunit epsilon